MVREARGQSCPYTNYRGLPQCSLERHSSGEIIRVDIMKKYVCDSCGTRVIKLWEVGDISFERNMLDDDADYSYDDVRNIGYTWYCVDGECQYGWMGWHGDRTECPMEEEE